MTLRETKEGGGDFFVFFKKILVTARRQLTRQSPLNVFEEFFFSAKSVFGEIFFQKGIKWDLTRQLPSSRQEPNGRSQHFLGRTSAEWDYRAWPSC